MIQIMNLFPIPLGTTRLDRSLTADEQDFIVNKLPFRQNALNWVSEDTYVLNYAPLQNLKIAIQQSVNEYFKDIHIPKSDVSLNITQSWVNITNKGEAHQSHKHWNSMYSGVFYINAVEGIDKIYFHHYNSVRDIQVIPEEWNIYNSLSWWIPVKTGDLIIFPSWLYHSVEPVEHEEKRISLSFNTFPSGKLGDFHSSTELIIPYLGIR